MKWILIALFVYGFLFGDLHASLRINNSKYKMEYNGIVWVALDRWSIWKYHSLDKPMKFISFSKKYKQKADHLPK